MSAAPFGYGRVRASFTDIGLLIGRLTIGVTLLMHGWQKFTQMGYGGVVEMLSGVGAPFAQVSAALLILLEVVGSAALIVGLFTRVVAVLIAVSMTGALLLIHLPNGFFVTDGGYELVLMIGGTALIYAFAGPGRLAIDAVFLLSFVRRGGKADADGESGQRLTGRKDDATKPAAGGPAPADPRANKPAPVAAHGPTSKAPSATPSPAPSSTTGSVRSTDRPEAAKPDGAASVRTGANRN